MAIYCTRRKEGRERTKKKKSQQTRHVVKSTSAYLVPIESTKLTMKTSNSSRHLNGDSIASQRAMMKDTVENERSPPDSERVSLATLLVPLSTFTWRYNTPSYRYLEWFSTAVRKTKRAVITLANRKQGS